MCPWACVRAPCCVCVSLHATGARSPTCVRTATPPTARSVISHTTPYDTYTIHPQVYMHAYAGCIKRMVSLLQRSRMEGPRMHV
eukprot:38058-Eustigmatos_ZCMA.PRE.1